MEDDVRRPYDPEALSTLLADLREAHQRLIAANERLQELRAHRAPEDDPTPRRLRGPGER